MIVKHQEKYVNVNSVIKYLKQQLKKERNLLFIMECINLLKKL